MQINQKCFCLSPEKPDGGGRLLADRKCRWCHGEGIVQITVTYEPPPYVKGADYNAVVEGWEEDGPVGYGGTKVEAVQRLMNQLEEN